MRPRKGGVESDGGIVLLDGHIVLLHIGVDGADS